MKRPAMAEDTLRRLEAWRRICPELTVRSTFIVGFPGETEAQFEELLAWLKEAKIDRAGAFAYSPVDGATANKLPGALDEDVKQDRLKRFMKAQEKISKAKLKKKVGTVMKVLIDEIGEQGEIIARSSADAPEIDGKVYVNSSRPLKPGQFVEVEIVQAAAHDLLGELVE